MSRASITMCIRLSWEQFRRAFSLYWTYTKIYKTIKPQKIYHGLCISTQLRENKYNCAQENARELMNQTYVGSVFLYEVSIPHFIQVTRKIVYYLQEFILISSVVSESTKLFARNNDFIFSEKMRAYVAGNKLLFWFTKSLYTGKS